MFLYVYLAKDPQNLLQDKVVNLDSQLQEINLKI